jgi:hypothetical protein
LQSLKKASREGFSFAKINSITYRLEPESGALVGLRRSAGLPLCASSQASERLSFAEAKKAAVAMLDDRGKAESHDWIAELNQLAAEEVDRVERDRQRKYWPVDLPSLLAAALGKYPHRAHTHRRLTIWFHRQPQRGAPVQEVPAPNSRLATTRYATARIS